MANNAKGAFYIDAPEKMEPGMEDSVDSRKNPGVDHCNARWIPACAGMTGSFAEMTGRSSRE